MRKREEKTEKRGYKTEDRAGKIEERDQKCLNGLAIWHSIGLC